MANLPCLAGACPHPLMATWSVRGGVLAKRMQRCENEGCIEAALAGVPWPPVPVGCTPPPAPPTPTAPRSHLPTHLQPATRVA